MTYKLLWTIPFAAALTACSTAEETTGTKTAAAQIATSGVSLASTGTFNTGNNPMTLAQNGKVSFVNDEVINVKVNPLSASASTNRKDFTFDVEIYGKTVTLTWDATESHYAGRVNGKDIFLKPKETGSDGGSWVASYDRLEIKGRNPSYIVWSVPLIYGYETADATVAAATGTATYTGNGRLSLQKPTNREWRKLDASLSVNFNNQTVAGSMKISEAVDHTKMTAGTLTIPTTAISGNGFAANNAQITINQSVNQTNNSTTQYALSNADVSGTFYGVNGGVLGGDITADGTINTIDSNGNTTSVDVVVNGGYITED